MRNVYYSDFATPAAHKTKAVVFFVNSTPRRCVDCVFATPVVHAIKYTASLAITRKGGYMEGKESTKMVASICAGCLKKTKT